MSKSRREARLLAKCAELSCIIQTVNRCQKCRVFVCRKHEAEHPCEKWIKMRRVMENDKTPESSKGSEV